jgi:hypothetical protein
MPLNMLVSAAFIWKFGLFLRLGHFKARTDLAMLNGIILITHHQKWVSEDKPF